MEQRSEIYGSSQFRGRLKRFHGTYWDDRTRTFLVSPGDTYSDLTDSLSHTDADLEGVEIALEPYLSEHQARVLNALLPFPGKWNDRDTIVLIGRGAPGSGKTVVGAEAARAAREACEYSVLVLCPTSRLRASYATALQSSAAEYGPFAPGSPPALCLEETQRFLALVAGEDLPDASRDRMLFGWWRETVEAPALNGWRKKYPMVRSTRFVRLLDAALEDDVELEGRSRDPLDKADWVLYKRLNEFRSSRSWRTLATANRRRMGLRLRCEVARDAAVALRSSMFWQGNLLVLVDEAQDLAPSELRALMDWVACRHKRHPGTRLALLGDENQRVAPTAFAWADVREHAAEELGWSDRCVSEIELPGSYRLNRTIAEFACLAFHKGIAAMDDARHVSLPVLERLPVGGKIRLVICSEPPEELDRATRLFALARESTERLIVLVEDGHPLLAHEVPDRGVDVIPTRIAKGLEFRTVVVLEPFGRGKAKLGFAQAATAFTALTRATDRVLVVLSPDEATHLIAAVGELPAGVEVVDLESTPANAPLADHLLEFAEEMSLAGQLEVALLKWKKAIEGLSLNSDEGVARQTARDIVAHAERLLVLGGAGLVASDLAGDLLPHPGLEAGIREAISEARGTGRHANVLAALLLLGECGIAQGYFEESAQLSGGAVEDLRGAMASNPSDELSVLVRRLHAEHDLPVEVPGATALNPWLRQRMVAELELAVAQAFA